MTDIEPTAARAPAGEAEANPRSFESTVVAALRADRDRPVRTDGLLGGALTRARTIRRRRRLLGAAAGAGLVIALVAGLVAVHGLVRAGSAAPPAVGADPPIEQAVPPAPPGEATNLPEAVGRPGAADRPDAVGTDPSLFHFDLRLSALDVAAATWWISAPGYEGVTVRHDSVGAPYAEVLMGREADRLDEVAAVATVFTSGRGLYSDAPEPTTVGGRPATLTRTDAMGDTSHWTLRWAPVDGLFARVQVFRATDRSAVYEVAGALRLDVAQRCAVPLRIAAPPRDGTWTACDTAIRSAPHRTRGVWIHSLVTFATPGGRTVSVWAEEDMPRAGLDTSQFEANVHVAGHPAQWSTDDPRGLWVPGFGPIGELGILGASKAESIRVAAGVTVVGDLADPRTWPGAPIG
jgi:hypothetical protein